MAATAKRTTATTTATTTKTTRPSAPKLSDTALVLLAAAADREDRTVLPPPSSVKARGAALEKVLASMLRRGLVEEVSTNDPDAAWRTDATGERTTLVATEVGLAAADLGGEDELNENALDTDRAGADEGDGNGKATAVDLAEAPTAALEHAPILRTGTKAEAVLDLLRRAEGATLEKMQAVTGWQAHSVRGFLSGAVRKKPGLDLTSEKEAGAQRRYRVASDRAA